MEEQPNQPDIRQTVTEKFKIKITDPYAHIVLDPVEIEQALRRARQEKSATIKTLEYSTKISKPTEWPKLIAPEFKDYIIQKAKLTMPGFIIDENNREIFDLMCLYFTRDIEFEARGYILDKGLALQGPVGCGKTTLLKLFSVNPTNSYRIMSCRKVADEYTNKEHGGEPVVIKYSGLYEVYPSDFWGQKYIGSGFDDLGTENVSKHMGNQKNVMEEVLQNRYDSSPLLGKTHITTNLSAVNIEDYYGPRVRSRSREMFNWLTFSNTAADRRR